MLVPEVKITLFSFISFSKSIPGYNSILQINNHPQNATRRQYRSIPFPLSPSLGIKSFNRNAINYSTGLYQAISSSLWDEWMSVWWIGRTENPSCGCNYPQSVTASPSSCLPPHPTPASHLPPSLRKRPGHNGLNQQIERESGVEIMAANQRTPHFSRNLVGEIRICQSEPSLQRVKWECEMTSVLRTGWVVCGSRWKKGEEKDEENKKYSWSRSVHFFQAHIPTHVCI